MFFFSFNKIFGIVTKERIKKMNKPNLVLIGFLQALGIIIYCFLIAGLFRLLEKFLPASPVFLGSSLILALLVFSAAVTGSIVFGYSAYLAFKKELKRH